jgi:hypothetical protein
MPQLRVSFTPLYLSATADPRELRALISAAVWQIKTADLVLAEWIEFVVAADTVLISDAVIQEFSKVLADASALSDALEQAIGLGKTDQATFTDAEIRDLSKVLADSASIQEAATLALDKALADTATVTDQSILDLSKAAEDASAFTDARVNHFTKVAFSEYAIDYFLEDYTEATDYVYTADAQVFAIGKVLSDTIGATDDVNGVLADDDQIIGFFKSLDNVGTVSESKAFDLSTPRADAFSITDSPSIGLDRPVSDSSTFTDAQVLAIGLGPVEAPNFTDALQYDGAYILADAASVAESAALQFSRPASDSFSASDASVLGFGLGPSDTATFTDNGELLNQDYTEAFYFAEDYVGTSRTF